MKIGGVILTRTYNIIGYPFLISFDHDGVTNDLVQLQHYGLRGAIMILLLSLVIVFCH